MQRTRGVAVTPNLGPIQTLPALTPCQTCGVRRETVCGAVELVDLGHLAAIAVSIRVTPGRGFIDEGDAARHFFNVTSGTAKLFKLLPDGRRQITGFAGAGHFLGLAVSDTYAFGAEAVDAVTLCRYPRAQLVKLLAAFPAMQARLLQVASNELVAAQEQMLLLGRKTARERVASFLVARGVLSGGRAGGAADGSAIDLPMRRGDIGDYLGLTIETVSRTLTRLAGAGIIAIPVGSRITIRNPAALKAMANGLHVVASPR